MIDHKFTLEAAREALLGAQERGAVLERALYHERTARLQAEERVAELRAILHREGQREQRMQEIFEAAGGRRIAALEGLIAEHAATCDEACTGCGTTAMQRHREPCPWRDAYLSHHSRVTEPERLKAELRASVKAAERKRGGRR